MRFDERDENHEILSMLCEVYRRLPHNQGGKVAAYRLRSAFANLASVFDNENTHIVMLNYPREKMTPAERALNQIRQIVESLS